MLLSLLHPSRFEVGGRMKRIWWKKEWLGISRFNEESKAEKEGEK